MSDVSSVSTYHDGDEFPDALPGDLDYLPGAGVPDDDEVFMVAGQSRDAAQAKQAVLRRPLPRAPKVSAYQTPCPPPYRAASATRFVTTADASNMPPVDPSFGYEHPMSVCATIGTAESAAEGTSPRCLKQQSMAVRPEPPRIAALREAKSKTKPGAFNTTFRVKRNDELVAAASRDLALASNSPARPTGTPRGGFPNDTFHETMLSTPRCRRNVLDSPPRPHTARADLTMSAVSTAYGGDRSVTSGGHGFTAAGGRRIEPGLYGVRPIPKNSAAPAAFDAPPKFLDGHRGHGAPDDSSEVSLKMSRVARGAVEGKARRAEVEAKAKEQREGRFHTAWHVRRCEDEMMRYLSPARMAKGARRPSQEFGAQQRPSTGALTSRTGAGGSPSTAFRTTRRQSFGEVGALSLHQTPYIPPAAFAAATTEEAEAIVEDAAAVATSRAGKMIDPPQSVVDFFGSVDALEEQQRQFQAEFRAAVSVAAEKGKPLSTTTARRLKSAGTYRAQTAAQSARVAELPPKLGNAVAGPGPRPARPRTGVAVPLMTQPPVTGDVGLRMAGEPAIKAPRPSNRQVSSPANGKPGALANRHGSGSLQSAEVQGQGGMPHPPPLTPASVREAQRRSTPNTAERRPESGPMDGSPPCTAGTAVRATSRRVGDEPSPISDASPGAFSDDPRDVRAWVDNVPVPPSAV